MAEAVKDHLYDLLKDFSTAMLVSGSNRHAHARPMAVAELKPDAHPLFVTDARSPKVAEIGADPNVLVTFQSSNEFATIAGIARIVRDRATIERLWSEAWRVWFPQGKDDPNLVVIRVEPRNAEYWDNSGVEGLRYAFEGVRAYLAGRTPVTDRGLNAKVDLSGRG